MPFLDWQPFRVGTLYIKTCLKTVPRRYFFCGSFVLFMSNMCHVFASVYNCLVVTFEGKRLTSWLLFVMFIVVLLLSLRYPGTGVVLD